MSLTSLRAWTKRVRRFTPGFTLVEVVVGTGLLVGLVLAWTQFVASYSRTSKRGRFDVHMTQEHEAMLSVARTVSRDAILLRDCVFFANAAPPTFPNETALGFAGPRPHPYRWINPNTGECQSRANPQTNTNPPVLAPQYIKGTFDFYETLWRVPITNYTRYPVGTDLNIGALTAVDMAPVAAATNAAGCFNCHDGLGGVNDPLNKANTPNVPGWIIDCNFSNPNHFLGVGSPGTELEFAL